MTESSPTNSLIGQFARGTLWLGSSNVIVLVASLVSQVFLGWILIENDFGVFALALGVTAFVDAFKDGGVAHWLIQQPREAVEEAIARGFWIAVAFSFVVAGTLAALAPVAALLFDESGVTSVLLVIAAGIPLSSYWTIASARLTVDLRFRTLAGVNTTVSLIRSVLVVLFALAGFGPLSFALPLVIGQLFATVAGYWTTHLTPWTMKSTGWTDARQVFIKTRWALAGTLARGVVERADYAILGLVVATPIVGLYYFAYQLPFRLAGLFYGEMGKVVVPLLAGIRDHTKRFANAVVRGTSLLGVMTAPIFLLLALAIPDLEHILWRGRWADAVVPAQILAALFPFEILERFATMILRSLGSFRAWTTLSFYRGIGLALAAVAAGLGFGDSIVPLTSVVGGYLAASAAVVFVLVLRTVGVGVIRPMRQFFSWYAISTLVAGLTYSTMHLLQVSKGFIRLGLSGFLFTLLLGVAAAARKEALAEARQFVGSVRGSR